MYRDTQLDPPVCYCDYCGGEIYEGEVVARIDGYTLHEDCLLDWVLEHRAKLERIEA